MGDFSPALLSIIYIWYNRLWSIWWDYMPLRYFKIDCIKQLYNQTITLSEKYNATTFCTTKSDGNYAFPQRCTKYVTCSNGAPFVITCPGNLHYNPSTNQCDYPLTFRCLEFQGTVCYGAKNNAFDTFEMTRGGKLRQLTLEHKSGFVSCDIANPSAKSNWGCGVGVLSVRMGTVVTRSNNAVLFPFFALDNNGYYGLARTDTFSRTLTLYNFDKEIEVWNQETMRVWHSEDLVKNNEQNNGGTHCVNVYAIFEQ